MVAVFLAPGFEEIEAVTPVDLLRRAGVGVQLVGVGGREVTGAHGITLGCDTTLEALDPTGLEMVVLPGGQPGTDNLAASPEVAHWLRHCVAHNLWIAAICAAPSVPGRMGLLQGRRVTCYPGFAQYLQGAEHTGAPVEQDGRIITGRGPGVARQFGLRLVAALAGEEAARQVNQGLQCEHHENG